MEKADHGLGMESGEAENVTIQEIKKKDGPKISTLAKLKILSDKNTELPPIIKGNYLAWDFFD